MSDKFTVEIISPDQTILKQEERSNNSLLRRANGYFK